MDGVEKGGDFYTSGQRMQFIHINYFSAVCNFAELSRILIDSPTMLADIHSIITFVIKIVARIFLIFLIYFLLELSIRKYHTTECEN